MDLMPNIIRIVHDAIQDGLIRSESLRRFKRKTHPKTGLKGKELEDYIQKLWDEL